MTPSVSKQPVVTLDSEITNAIDAELPEPLVAPFDEATAKAAQESWAQALGREVEETNSIGMKLRLIPAGEFQMGSTKSSDELARVFPDNGVKAEYFKDAFPQHRVGITKPFYLQTTEVTQSQWKAVMGTEPWKNKGRVKEGADYPATYVSHGLNADGTVEPDSVTEFSRKLSAKEGVEYRLPTEAESEYACRAGSPTIYSFGDNVSALTDFAWTKENAWDVNEMHAHQVGQKRANAWGLFDMHGNVFEWCGDWYDKDYYHTSSQSDPRGPASGSSRVNRGGSWVHLPLRARSATRYGGWPDVRYGDLGFRLVCSLTQSEDRKQPVVESMLPSPESPTAVTPHQVQLATPLQPEITNTIEMKFKLIPAGEFLMGSPLGQLDRQTNEQPHDVRITKPFYLQTTEVTQGQWEAVMGTKPWSGKPLTKEGYLNPATSVSWDDAEEFCQKLGDAEGTTYRLPSEAEWEYACRAGSVRPFSFGGNDVALNRYAWFRSNAWLTNQKYAHGVGQKQPNNWGLYDMHGNVQEWCGDWYQEEYNELKPVADPSGPSKGWERVVRVVRGGSWLFDAQLCRSARRYGYKPDRQANDLGFRVVLTSELTTSTLPTKLSQPKQPQRQRSSLKRSAFEIRASGNEQNSIAFLRGRDVDKKPIFPALRIKQEIDGHPVEVSFWPEVVTDQDLAHIASLTSLKKLSIGHNYQSGVYRQEKRQAYLPTEVTSDGIGLLTALSDIEELRIDGIDLTDESLEHIGKLSKLRSFSVLSKHVARTSGSMFTDRGLRALSELKKLESLSLGGCRHFTDDGLTDLGQLSQLKSLNLSLTQITDAGLKHLQGLTKLEELLLYECGFVSGNGMSALATLSQLRELDVGGTRISDAGMQHLSGLSNLEVFWCSSTQVSDEGLGHLKPLTKLRDLNLFSTRITDGAIETLQELRNLQGLNLRYTGFTPAGIARLKAILPNAKISANPK
ncbi:MAG: SUMF1/EgtB/PvdO family nonheme iron enzyme [Rhodopirellula sp.]|nr:SUMF1/EgtB/PvdO family nonheme iron enzyme [Rhodopirellula sp.]